MTRDLSTTTLRDAELHARNHAPDLTDPAPTLDALDVQIALADEQRAREARRQGVVEPGPIIDALAESVARVRAARRLR